MTHRIVPLRWLAVAAIVSLVLAHTPSARAQTATITTLASFNGTNGATPQGDVTLIGSTLYGTTFNGGASSDGTVFSVPIGGGTPTTLASFNGTNGANPAGSLTLIGSTLYGTTDQGGAMNLGTVFYLPLSGGTPTTLASFNGTNGANPLGDVTLIGNTLYGTTQAGGVNSDGTVFAVSLAPEPGTWVAMTLGVGVLAVTQARRRKISERSNQV